jgi:hypothetical protein
MTLVGVVITEILAPLSIGHNSDNLCIMGCHYDWDLPKDRFDIAYLCIKPRACLAKRTKNEGQEKA